jgi:CHAT domain-containing protein
LLLAEVSRLEREIRHRFPDYPALVAPKFPTIAEVQSRLKPDQALIATYSTDTATHVWAVPKQGKAAFATVPVGRAQIAALVKHLRKGLEYRDDTLAGIPVFDVDLAHEFYQMLLVPVASGWKPAKELLVVAHGALRELPFSLLVTKKASVRDGQRSLFAGYKDVVWLVRSHGVTSLPTITSIIAPPPARRLNSKRRNFVGFADPWFNAAQAKETRPRIQMASAIPPQKEPGILLRAMPRLLGDRTKTRLRDLPRLPQTAYEVAAIARWLQADPARDIFTGARANEQQVKTMDLTPYRVVAFATHAVVPKELDGLTQPALALTAPQIAGVGGDGLLTMDEILNLKLNADWVVLSGCNTGRGAGIGADALSGLARAFLQAGARSLLMTQWEVESTVARLLVGDLFRRQAENRGLSRSEAMRQAKLALIDGAGYPDTDGETLFSYAHPLFWAPFVLYGDSSQALMPTKN